MRNGGWGCEHEVCWVYCVEFDESAIDFLKKLPLDIRRRIYSKIVSTKNEPFHFFERLSGRSDYKLHVGDYRVIADISQNKYLIQITLIGHRKKIYSK